MAFKRSVLLALLVCAVAPYAEAQAGLNPKPRLSVTLASKPLVAAPWETPAGSAAVATPTVHAALSPAASEDAAAACAAAGGSVTFTVAPDEAKMAKQDFKVTATAAAWTWRPNSANMLPKSGPVNVPVVVTPVCSKPEALAGTKAGRGSLAMDIKVEGCDACLAGCTLSATAGAPPTCEAFAGHCPPSWPNPEGVEGAGWSLTMKFTPKAGQALCSDVNFGGHPSKVAANADYLLNEMFRASGKQAVNRYGEKPPASKQAAGTAAVCKEPAQIGRSYGIVQVFMDSTPYKNGTVEKFKKDLQNKWMMRNACPRDEDIPANMDPDIRAVLTDFCEKVGSPTDPITWAGVCVQDANPNKKYKVDGPIEKACFPGDALVTLLDPTNGAPLRKARMDELRIGDAVACLKPAARAGPGLARDDAQRYVPGACRVFNYHDVDAAATLPYVALHYTDASGAPSKLRATKEHLVYLAPSSLTTSDAPDGLPPGGSARRADMVVVGDLLAVAAGGGAFYTARVEKVTTERHTGAFAPLLTDAGLPIVDGAVAFAWAHLPEHDPHPAQNLGEFYRHIRLVRDFNDSLASGCAGAACPCLDAPDDAGRRCARLGDRLADMPAGLSDFAERTVGVWERAAAQGRNYWDYERGVALGRFWEGSQITQWAATRLLRLKPHTFAMAATDFLMVRPPAGAAGAYADATRAAAAAARAESAVAGLPAAS